MKRAILVAAALGLILTLLIVGPPGAAQEHQLQKAPKRVTVVKSQRVFDVFDGHGRGFIPPPMDLSYLTGQRMPGERVSARNVSTPPASFDWRTTGKVTSVKDQGACGSCYAFAAIANFESKMLIDSHATLPYPDYSENNAKECNYWETANIFGGTSCSGGNHFQVANWLSKKGTVLESCDPYVASDVTCNGTCPYQETLLDLRIICGDVVPDTDALKTYIQTYGPVYTSMYASFAGFGTYNGTYTLYYTGTQYTNHAVLIIGWDDSLSHAGNTTGGWIVKNSWGTGWGNGGYFTIAYGSASIGKYSSFLYDWQDYDEHGDLYYYDECGWTQSWGQQGGQNTTCWGLCKFTPTNDAPVVRVEFWTTDITTDVDVYLYDDFNGENLSNLLASKLDSSFSEAGYHSVELDTPVPMSTGDDVIAVVKFTNSSWGYPVATDEIGPHETGRTYISITGATRTWLDMGNYSEDDVCIRLRTPALPPTVTTADASNITSSSATLNGSLGSLGDYSSANVSFEWGTEPGVYSDNTTPEAMTSIGSFSANLSSLSPSTNYYFRTKATGSVTVYGSELSFTTLKVLVSIGITPDNPTIALGRNQQFTATGTYSDSSTPDITDNVTWASDNTSVATIDAAGLAQSLAQGTANITATWSGKSDNTTLTVSPKVLDTIDITPDNPTIAAGRTQQFTATGTYSDNSTPDITDNVTWASDNTSVATIDAAGLAQSLVQGTANITATWSGKSDNTTLTVDPKVLDALAVTPANPSIDAGNRQQFTAIGTYSDSSTDNITGTVTWNSSNTTVANINAAGLVKSYTEGTTVITATSGNISDNSTLTVDPAVLDSVIVTPINPEIAFVSDNPPTVWFIATAIYSDGAATIVTGTANWASSDNATATIAANTGLATTVAAGTTTIAATFSGTTGNTTFTVLPDIVAPVVTLTSPTEGLIINSANLTVTGSVDDVNATANITLNGEAPSALTLVNGDFSDNVTLNAGSNTVLVTAVDGSGNTGTSGTITVVVDPNKPNVTITQPVAGIVTDNSSLAVAGTVSGNVTSANLILNGLSQSANVTGGSFSANVTLVEGINILVVVASDNATPPNTGTSGVRIVTLDTTPPVIVIDSPVPGSVLNTPGCEVSGTIDDSSVSTANLTLNSISQSVTVVGGTFSQKIHLEPGNNPITIMAADELGNTSSANVTVIFDNTKPEVTIISPANNTFTNTANQTITGTVDDLSINTANLTVNDGTPQAVSVSSGSFSANVTLATGANTLEVRASDNATPPNTGTSGVVNVTLDNTAPTITVGLNDPTVSITITVTSNEGLAAAPTVSVNSTVTMTPVGVNQWTGTFEPIPAGAYIVTANATDRAGNTTTRTATFCKQTVTISENATETVETATTTLEISTTANVTGASISVTQHLANPSGNVGDPADAEVEVGVFIEIVASPELRDNLEQIYITVDYDPNELSAGTDESTLRLYLWDVATGTWQVVPGSGVNTGAHYIYGTVTHLSKYGGFGTVEEESAQPPGGGGGGGGGGGAGMVKLNGLTATTELLVDRFGRAQDNYQLKSLDEKVSIDIARKTKLLDSQGEPLESLSAEVVASPLSPSAERSIICAYDFGPDGAIFEPAIILTMSYDPEALPEGVIEDELYLAYFDDSQWQALESTVNIETNTTSANISHFTQFALTGKLPPPAPPPPAPARVPAPASFAVSDLSVAPGEVKLAEQVTISAVVTNTGGSRGSYTAVLKINGAEEARKEVTLGAGKSETVTFTIAKDTEGSYTVNIDGKVGQFTVIIPPPTPIPTEALPVQPPTNWWLIGGIIAGCVVVAAGLLAYFFVWRKRRAPQPS